MDCKHGDGASVMLHCSRVCRQVLVLFQQSCNRCERPRLLAPGLASSDCTVLSAAFFLIPQKLWISRHALPESWLLEKEATEASSSLATAQQCWLWRRQASASNGLTDSHNHAPCQLPSCHPQTRRRSAWYSPAAGGTDSLPQFAAPLGIATASGREPVLPRRPRCLRCLRSAL